MNSGIGAMRYYVILTIGPFLYPRASCSLSSFSALSSFFTRLESDDTWTECNQAYESIFPS